MGCLRSSRCSTVLTLFAQYQLPGLVVLAKADISKRVRNAQCLHTLVAVGLFAFAQEGLAESPLLQFIVARTAQELHLNNEEDVSETGLLDNQHYAYLVLHQFSGWKLGDAPDISKKLGAMVDAVEFSSRVGAVCLCYSV